MVFQLIRTRHGIIERVTADAMSDAVANGSPWAGPIVQSPVAPTPIVADNRRFSALCGYAARR